MVVTDGGTCDAPVVTVSSNRLGVRRLTSSGTWPTPATETRRSGDSASAGFDLQERRHAAGSDRNHGHRPSAQLREVPLVLIAAAARRCARIDLAPHPVSGPSAQPGLDRSIPGVGLGEIRIRTLGWAPPARDDLAIFLGQSLNDSRPGVALKGGTPTIFTHTLPAIRIVQ